jgi:hypothetical protein
MRYAQNVTVQLPQIDLVAIIPTLVLPFITALAQAIANALVSLWNGLINSGINVLTRTAPEWTYANADIVGLVNDLQNGINGITALSVVIVGIGLIGRELWGFSWGPVEAFAKIAIAVALATSVLRLCAWSIDLVDAINSGLGGVSLAAPPQLLVSGSVLDTLVSALLLIPWVVCGLLLWLFMAERLGMLALLLVIAPVVVQAWGIPQARWVTVQWARDFFGWLIAQPLALVCLKLAAVEAGLFGGGSTSVLFGIAMLILARQAARMFISGGMQDWGGTAARMGIGAATGQLAKR